jgi:hypothetical protein
MWDFHPKLSGSSNSQPYCFILWWICSRHCWVTDHWAHSNTCATQQYCGSVSFMSAHVPCSVMLYSACAGDVTQQRAAITWYPIWRNRRDSVFCDKCLYLVGWAVASGPMGCLAGDDVWCHTTIEGLVFCAWSVLKVYNRYGTPLTWNSGCVDLEIGRLMCAIVQSVPAVWWVPSV